MAMVPRRAIQNPGKGVAVKQKPSIRKTIESMVSTGSQAEYFQPGQTIIIFDWDDTLCPSSWIRANKKVLSFFKPAPATEKYQKPLRELQASVEVLLKMAMKLGTVVIVTNAMDPWVETSCRNFLPSLLPLVSSLPVIYARSIFEQQGVEMSRSSSRSSSPLSRLAMPGLYAANGQNRLGAINAKIAAQQKTEEISPQKWKEVAFAQEIKDFYSRYQHQSWKNVISVGDSVFERDAVRRVVLQRPTPTKKCRTKTLKLFDDPEIEELIAQVKVVYDVINVMVQYDGDLDIEIDEDDLKLDGPLLDKLRD
ncbi:unnamed protein product [Effrenium voratum]|uniref:Uncharacterized protein n=1 Tax=Effrenium voratum TaxID=2562239 RepID=A0AA36IBR6_9DINO|nr:unnamed protein product [Effrenium voratum]CAJ1460207.1 unnamed protein product [Effrenium voratum]